MGTLVVAVRGEWVLVLAALVTSGRLWRGGILKQRFLSLASRCLLPMETAFIWDYGG